MNTVTKAVIPIAGLGSRFLPATKAIPKEMLPVFDRPVIELIVRDLTEAGVTDIIFVIPPDGSITPDHFKKDDWLEGKLRAKGKTALADEVANIAALANIHTVVQEQPLGDGDAILKAEDIIAGDDFFVFFGDELLFNSSTAPEQLLQARTEESGFVLGVQTVPQKDIHKFGIVAIGESHPHNAFEITGFVEKPKPEDAPSDMALLGKNLCTAAVFDAIRKANPSEGGELRLVDAFEILLGDQVILGCNLTGDRFDVGNPAGLLSASQFVAKAG
jgi:UTP--glucose-1-phosphate uridylyltransferase